MSSSHMLLECAGPLLSECKFSFCSICRCHLGVFFASSSMREDMFPFKWIGNFPIGLGTRSVENVFFKKMVNILPDDEMMSPGH